MSGRRIALDYTSLFMRMERLGLSDAEWNERFADLRVLEVAALDQMTEDTEEASR